MLIRELVRRYFPPPVSKDKKPDKNSVASPLLPQTDMEENKNYT